MHDSATSPLRSFIGGTWRDSGRLSRDLNPARPSEAVIEVLQANAQDMQKLSSSSFRQTIAQSLAHGFVAYFK